MIEIGSDNYTMMKSAITDYERLITDIADNFRSRFELEQLVRLKGRSVERALTGEELRIFLALRRYERNIMLYKNEESFAVFKSASAALSAMSRAEIRDYRVLVTKLYHLYKEENEAVEKVRQTARRIQSFTRNLSKKERSDIATTITMSVHLLLIGLALVVFLGIVINIKLATSISSPIRTLEKITKKIAQGDFSERIEVKGQDELSSLEASFNSMEEKLKNALWSLEHTIEKLREKQAQLVEAEKLASVGRGIPEESIRKIFDPFFTTKESAKGSGLGFAVSYGIVKKHRGDIEVASHVGKGTTFTVRLPIYGYVKSGRRG